MSALTGADAKSAGYRCEYGDDEVDDCFPIFFFHCDHGFKCLVFNLSPRRGDGYSPSLPSGLSPPADGVSPP